MHISNLSYHVSALAEPCYSSIIENANPVALTFLIKRIKYTTFSIDTSILKCILGTRRVFVEGVTQSNISIQQKSIKVRYLNLAQGGKYILF